MEAIVAVFSDWGIGADGTQQIVVKADRKRFRDVTGSDAVIVGRRTMEDFPGGRPLKGRHNIVITGKPIEIEGAEVVHNIEEALQAAAKQPRTICIGGAGVFRQFLPYFTSVYVTKIDACPKSDSFFANLDESPEWICAEDGEWLEEGEVRYKFCRYERIK